MKPNYDQIKKNYEAKPFKAWDYKTPVCLYDDSKFFYNDEDVDEYLAENDLRAQDLMLIICEPNYYPQVRYEDLVEDIMPEEWNGDFPKELERRLTELNEYIKTLKPCSWDGSGTYRTSYSPTPITGQ